MFSNAGITTTQVVLSYVSRCYTCCNIISLNTHEGKEFSRLDFATSAQHYRLLALLETYIDIYPSVSDLTSSVELRDVSDTFMIMKNQHFGGTRHISRNRHSSQETNTLFIVCFFENSRVQIPKPCCNEWHDVLKFCVENRLGDFWVNMLMPGRCAKTCQLKDGKFRVQYLARPRSAILHHPARKKFPDSESNQLTISGPVENPLFTQKRHY